LYDTDSTKVLVTQTISWYKQYRDILNASIVHLRRADGRDWDGWMHASPFLKDRAFVLLFNPTQEAIQRKIKIPMYYSALSGKATFVERGKTIRQLSLDPKGDASLDVTIPAEGYTWFVVRAVK
jgi:hypothetical protein